MNIVFKTLEMENFQSIGYAKIDLDERGTTIVKGINNYEENTDSNGSGKSSIFEGLYFSLFGKTTTGLTNVSNRYTGKDYKLSLEFVLDDVTYRIIRNGTKVTLLQNGEDISRRNKSDTDTFIRDNILKVSPEIFLNIIYLAQGFKARLSALTAGGRKDQIEEIIGTSEITENFRIQMQDLKEKLNTELNGANNKISYNNGTVNQINTNKDNYQKEIDRILEERKNQPSKEDLTNKINKLRSEQQELEQKQQEEINKINEIKEKNSQIQLNIANFENESITKINELNNKISELSNQSNEYRKDRMPEIQKLESDFALLQSNTNTTISNIDIKNSTLTQQITKNKNDIETLKTSDTCPTCGRKFDGFNQEHLVNELQKLIDANLENEKQINSNNEMKEQETKKILEAQELKDKNVNQIYKEIDEYSATLIEQTTKVVEELNNYKKEIEDKKSEMRKEIKDYSTEQGTLNNILTKINTIKSSITVLENEINNFKEESTENYEKLIKDCDKEIIKYVKENETLQKSCSELEEKIGVATHSISLISREFKNYLLKSAIEFLNNRLDYYSSQLFSNDSDRVKFIQDGNKLDIYLGDAIFESLSGGEKRKVDIIIMLAQKELASNMSNTYSNILILDEIFDGLDSKSIDITTAMLLSVSKDINSMFVVSHKDTVMGHDGLIIVTKGKDRISTVTQQ